MASRKTPDPGSATEAVNPRTANLDRLPPRVLLERIVAEDEGVAKAVRAVLDEIEAACERLTGALEAGGRWFNVGAGTSGRLGALDAAEIPPTFGMHPDRVQAIIAGGERALTQAVEGAEDDGDAAGRDLAARGLAADDVVVALSASGRTPYVLGAVAYAASVGAPTIAITCAPVSLLARAAEIAIAPTVGPEVIAGSTRMKGGLAQKMVLHSLSTAVMVRLGRVHGNRMTGMRPANAKLWERAIRILVDLSGRPEREAAQALEAHDGDVAAALESLGIARAR